MDEVLVIKTAVEHWPIGVAFVATLIAFSRWVIPWAMEKAFKNGSGIVIGSIIDKKLKEQDDRLDARMKQSFIDHESRERIEVAQALALARADARVESESIKTDVRNLRDDVKRIEDHLWPK